ncbi:MAG TPA: biotin--[acetyl-CoA-carboxylase] ligase [Aggregatilineales bacterium]|nr:biotin--[acetyl-CoA-carboxylase] ligase [Aggregatilineales bacterium]
MSLYAQELQARFAGRAYRYFEQTASTNDRARAWINEDPPAPHGAFVVADEQTAGRGRLGRTWETPPGSALAVSFVLHPPQKHIPQITMLGAVAVLESLERVGATDVAIKWPNDVLLNGLKVCGILTESEWKGSQLRGVILGIGLNVRVDFTGTPLEGRAVSVETALRRSVHRSDLLAHLVENLDRWSAKLGTRDLYETWFERLKTLGETVTVTAGEVRYEGIAVDARPDGALIVQTADGKRRAVYGGEVTTA